MIYFFICIVLFLIVLIYLVFSLSYILKSRSKVEVCEYALKKAITRKANFILGLSEDLLGEKKERLLGLESMMRKNSNVKDSIELNEAVDLFLTSMRLDPSYQIECKMLTQDIDEKKKLYNIEVDIFNSKVFKPYIGFLAKACKVQQFRKL